MANPFDNIISPLFKSTFNHAIDALLADNALTVPCSLHYESSNRNLCNNCIFDPISQRSLNVYNSNGPSPFSEQSICPVCNGYGSIDKSKVEKIYLAVIFDSKYWFNWANKNSINISAGSVQTLCSISYLPKLKNAQYMTMDTNISNYNNYSYTIAGDPQPCGLGSHPYLMTMWSRS
jgi:hypothetical protein